MAEIGLSESDVRKFGGASREKPGISEGFHVLGFTVGELARGGTRFLAVLETDFVTEGDLTGGAGADVFVVVDRVVGLRVGVAVLDTGLVAGREDLVVGVEDLAVDLAVGVEDLAGRVGLVEGNVGRVVGVEDLEGLDAVVGTGLDAVIDVGLDDVVDVGLDDMAGVVLDAVVEVGLDDVDKVGRPVGVPGLDPGPPDDEGLRIPAVEVVKLGDEAGCLDIELLFAVGSGCESASLDFSAVGRALGVPS